MEFCKKCGKPLIIADDSAKCICGFIKKAGIILSNEKIENQNARGEGIFNSKEIGASTGFPHKCKRCRHEFADVVDLGVFYSDESSIHLFTCKKCRHTERDVYGSSNK